MWFGTQGGVCSYDGRAFVERMDPAGKSFVNVRAMQIDRQGNLWFSGQQGACRYDGKTVSVFTTKEGRLADFVGSIRRGEVSERWATRREEEEAKPAAAVPGRHRTREGARGPATLSLTAPAVERNWAVARARLPRRMS